jgi:hypothetical protein
LTYGLVELRQIDGLGTCVQLGADLPLTSSSSPARLKARLLAEVIALEKTAQWFSRLGLIASQSFKCRTVEQQPEFGQFFWDMTSPSYMHPFTSRKAAEAEIPGFVVADVSINGQMKLPQVRAFLHKCDVIRHQKNSRPFLSMLVADHFAHDAFLEIRRRGSMAITLRNLLGDDIAQALNALIAILTNAAKVASTKPEVILEVFTKLNAIEGAAANLRGPLFELVVGHCVGAREGGTVDIQKSIREPGNQELTDIDVLQLKANQEVTAYECRGHLGNVTIRKSEVERWFKVTIPKIRSYFLDQDQFANIRHRFEFWTTGTFHADALTFLESCKSVRKFAIDWKSGDQVLKYVSETRTGKLDQVLREHYLNHPLARISSNRPKQQSPVRSEETAHPEGSSLLLAETIAAFPVVDNAPTTANETAAAS